MNVAIVDLLTQSPFYDRYLASAIAPLVDELTLYAIGWHREPGYLDSPKFVRSPGLIDVVGELGIRNNTMRQITKFAEYVTNWLYLLFEFRRDRPDVVHIQWLPMLERSSFQLQFVRQLQKMDIPVVYTVHNFSPHDSNAGWAYKSIYSTANHLITHTSLDAQRLQTEVGIAKERISTVPHGPLFYEQFGIDRRVARSQLNLGLDEFVFLMFGVIRPYKGFEVAVRALASIAEKYPNCRLLVAGNALDQAYLAQLKDLTASLNIQHLVDWHTGYISSDKVGVYHAVADVVLFPYKSISQSGALLTAAALGKCVLATNVGGIGEVIDDGKTGLLTESTEVGGLVGGMRRSIALTDKDRACLGKALKDQVLDELNWDTIAAKTIAIYKKVSSRETS